MGFSGVRKEEGETSAAQSFDLKEVAKVPAEFVWPEEERAATTRVEWTDVPTIDLGEISFSYHGGNEMDMNTRFEKISQQIGEACREHGFFQVINHGVPSELVEAAHRHADLFFNLPVEAKLKAPRRVGESFGYTSSYSARFTCRVPWKETLSLDYSPTSDIPAYFHTCFGDQLSGTGIVFQKYCQAMERFSLQIMELLAVSLGVERMHFRNFFVGNRSILRINCYPPCQQPSLALGTGAHCDPTSLTVLHQDDVAGLEVLVDDRWLTVPPTQNAFVVNIGDTFKALSNGLYKSCLHRAVVNSKSRRKSVVFFLNPAHDRVVRPPSDLVLDSSLRKYRDFTWPTFLHFTQNIYRPDIYTLDTFNQWLESDHTGFTSII
eukprot:Gb_17320 [translate_table: standard]